MENYSCKAYPNGIPSEILARDDDELWDEPCNPEKPEIVHKRGGPLVYLDGPHAFYGLCAYACEHYDGVKNWDGCLAYPNWIPDRIFSHSGCLAYNDNTNPCNPKRPEYHFEYSIEERLRNMMANRSNEKDSKPDSPKSSNE